MVDTDPIVFTEKLVHNLDETIKLHVITNKKLKINVYHLDQAGTRKTNNTIAADFNNYRPHIYSTTYGFVENGEVIEIKPNIPGWLIIDR